MSALRTPTSAPDGSGVGQRPAVRRDLHRTALLTGAYLLLALAAALTWAYLAAPSREHTTDFGTVPVNAQDEARIGGEMWLMIVLAVLGAGAGLLWWCRGPRRGPIALVALGGSVLIASGVAAFVGGLVASTRGSTPERIGVLYDLPATVQTAAPAVVPALVAVLCYVVAVLLTGDGSLRR